MENITDTDIDKIFNNSQPKESMLGLFKDRGVCIEEVIYIPGSGNTEHQFSKAAGLVFHLTKMAKNKQAGITRHTPVGLTSREQHSISTWDSTENITIKGVPVSTKRDTSWIKYILFQSAYGQDNVRVSGIEVGTTRPPAVLPTTPTFWATEEKIPGVLHADTPVGCSVHKKWLYLFPEQGVGIFAPGITALVHGYYESARVRNKFISDHLNYVLEKLETAQPVDSSRVADSLLLMEQTGGTFRKPRRESPNPGWLRIHNADKSLQQKQELAMIEEAGRFAHTLQRTLARQKEAESNLAVIKARNKARIDLQNIFLSCLGNNLLSEVRLATTTNMILGKMAPLYIPLPDGKSYMGQDYPKGLYKIPDTVIGFPVMEIGAHIRLMTLSGGIHPHPHCGAGNREQRIPCWAETTADRRTHFDILNTAWAARDVKTLVEFIRGYMVNNYASERYAPVYTICDKISDDPTPPKPVQEAQNEIHPS